MINKLYSYAAYIIIFIFTNSPIQCAEVNMSIEISSPDWKFRTIDGNACEVSVRAIAREGLLGVGIDNFRYEAFLISRIGDVVLTNPIKWRKSHRGNVSTEIIGLVVEPKNDAISLTLTRGDNNFVMKISNDQLDAMNRCAEKAVKIADSMNESWEDLTKSFKLSVHDAK